MNYFVLFAEVKGIGAASGAEGALLPVDALHGGTLVAAVGIFHEDGESDAEIGCGAGKRLPDLHVRVASLDDADDYPTTWSFLQ